MKVYLSKQAEFKLDLILIYLLEEWNLKVKDDFIALLREKIIQISTLPNSCPKSKVNKEIFKCVLTKRITLYYRINNNDVEIITFFDNRQNPKRKTKLL